MRGWLAAAAALLLAGCGQSRLKEVWRADSPGGRLAYWAEVGDANADGMDDLLVGSSGGGAALYYGTPGGFSREPGWRFEGGSPGALTGMCVGFAGDMDGDGYPEIYVAAPRDQNVGAVYIFRTGKNGPEAKPWKVLISPSRGEGFGEQCAAAGDVNGDGYADLAVADFGYHEHRGRVYVYYGSPRGIHSHWDWAAEGEQPGDWFGYSLCAAGDLDGDGVADLAIGSKNCSGSCLRWLAGDPRFELHRKYLASTAYVDATQTARAGKLYGYYGSRQGLEKTPGLIMEGEQPQSFFAFRIAALGDLDGDGKAELAVSSPGWQARRGKVEVFKGAARGAKPELLWSHEGEDEAGEIGYILASAGDLNADGRPDLVLGTLRQNRLEVYQGSPAGFAYRPAYILDGQDYATRWGAMVGSAGRPGPGMKGRLYALGFPYTGKGTPAPKPPLNVGWISVFSPEP